MKIKNISQLNLELSEVRGLIDILRQSIPELPDDLARISDIPQPPDLEPLAAKIQELEQRIAEVAEGVPTLDGLARLSDIPEPVDLTPVAVEIQALTDKIETVAIDLHAVAAMAENALARECPSSQPILKSISDIERATGATSSQIDAIQGELAILRASVQEVAGQRQEMPDLSGIESRIHAMEHRPDPEPDLSEIEERLATLEQIELPTYPEPDLSPIMDALAGIHARLDQIETRQSTIRDDMTETRQWLADLGRQHQAATTATQAAIREITGGDA